MNAPALHVVVKGATLVCTHCATERRLEQPERIRAVVATAQVFLGQHAECPKPFEVRPC